MDYFFIILLTCFLLMGMTICGIYFLVAYFGLNPLGRLENRLCWVASMGPFGFWLLSVGTVQGFSLPNVELNSEVDTSTNLDHSLQNSGEFNQYELSFNLSSLTLVFNILLLLLVIYLHNNIRSALLALNTKVNHLQAKVIYLSSQSQYGKGSSDSAIQPGTCWETVSQAKSILPRCLGQHPSFEHLPRTNCNLQRS